MNPIFSVLKKVNETNIFKTFRNIFGKPGEVSISQANTVIKSTENDQKLFKAYGITSDVLGKLLTDNLVLTSDFVVLCRAVEQSLSHPLMSSAVSAFSDSSVQRSSYNQKIAWVESDSKEYKYEIEKMFDIINLEEIIYDWAWTTSLYGNLFVEVNGQKGVGIINVNDSLHPSLVNRIDLDGRLVGFYEMIQGYVPNAAQILPPYKYVHFRILQGKKRRGNYAQGGSEYRTSVLMGPDIRRTTTKLGTSVLNDALPIYRRLKLTEDAILMSRLSKGLKRYIYKVVVPEGSSPDMVAALIDNYVDVLKNARSMNIDPSNPSYQEKFQNISAAEDIILPIWGNANNFEVEELKTDTDIKWIVDLEELRNQLSCALKVPLSILGGYQKDENSGNLNGTSAERNDIRFARQVRKVQNALINGLTRMAQIHLAYLGMSPDLNMFKIRMAEVSTAEELEMQKGLSESADTIDKLTDLIVKHTGDVIDKVELLNYFNQKLLKLEDLDLRKLMKDAQNSPKLKTSIELPKPTAEAPSAENPFRESRMDSDLKGALPIDEGGTNKLWESQYGSAKVRIEESLNE